MKLVLPVPYSETNPPPQPKRKTPSNGVRPPRKSTPDGDGPALPPLRTFLVERPNKPDVMIAAHEWTINHGCVCFHVYVVISNDGEEMVAHSRMRRAFAAGHWVDVQEILDVTKAVN